MKRTRPRSPSQATTTRRGAFAIVVLICLLMAGMIVAALFKMALLHDRQLSSEQKRLQAAWLADSGLDRAASRLAREPGYAGETWKIEPAQLGGADAAVVVIRVQKHEADTGLRTIVVAATYPAEGPNHVRLTREVDVAVTDKP